ncbi:hypothetical protein Pla110_33230 [Polystyrenella longa]|uniref:Uncharacterized protein n=1 Tax=Polystyrenella longa TaxID=2528007 RepID=A0A518CQS7_9PLAN|nr:hypothetical protein [Polystyrenella longa]QDU81581.1 hypothetical protein Pla110_33230 [Polystyrenella longa]
MDDYGPELNAIMVKIKAVQRQPSARGLRAIMTELAEYEQSIYLPPEEIEQLAGFKQDIWDNIYKIERIGQNN